MNFYPSLEFVMLRADAEAKAANATDVTVDFLFLGLLKLAEMRAADFIKAPKNVIRAVDEDIYEVNAIFKRLDVNTSRARALLRAAVAKGVSAPPHALVERFFIAAGCARERGDECIAAHDMLYAILDKPTDAILQVYPLKNEDASPQPVKKPAPVPEEKPAKKKGLFGLFGKKKN